jgi:hypothetical protein
LGNLSALPLKEKNVIFTRLVMEKRFANSVVKTIFAVKKDG